MRSSTSVPSLIRQKFASMKNVQENLTYSRSHQPVKYCNSSLDGGYNALEESQVGSGIIKVPFLYFFPFSIFTFLFFFFLEKFTSLGPQRRKVSCLKHDQLFSLRRRGSLEVEFSLNHSCLTTIIQQFDWTSFYCYQFIYYYYYYYFLLFLFWTISSFQGLDETTLEETLQAVTVLQHSMVS